jgi:tetratricopeptide (TPR) repeat protein
MIALHPLFGWGPETFGAQFPLHESLDLARAYPDFYHESPHNLLLDITVGQGLPALFAFLALCAIAFRSGLRSPSLLAGLAALLAAHLFVVFTVPVELALYLLLAMLISLDAPPRRAAPSGTALAQYALAALFLILTVRLLVPDALLARAQRQIANGNVTAAAGAYHASLQWQPSGPGADLAYSREMAVLAATSPVFRTRLDALQQAFESGIRATEHSDQRQNAWYNLAELFAAQNDAPSTERSLRNAIAWSPNWFKPHYILAQLLESQHRLSEALMEAQAAVERDGGRDPEVANTLVRVRRAAAEQ